MKKSSILITVLAMILVMVIIAFTTKQTATIKGWVSPKEAGVAAWAIAKNDTFKTHITSEGVFEIFKVKPGIYTVAIQAAAPYKTAQRDAVTVTEGAVVDLGEIKLEK